MRIRLRAAAWTLGIGLALSSIGSADETMQLQFRLGLWQMTVQPQLAGAAAITSEQLQSLPPDQRARAQALVQSAIAQATKQRVFKECMNDEKRNRAFKAIQPSADNSCQRTIVTNTAHDFEMRQQCPATRVTTTVRFQLTNPEHVTGTVVGTTPGASGATVTINATFEGQWLDAQCGTIKDVQPVP
jgi:Protein of unknown function (DUF3617)